MMIWGGWPYNNNGAIFYPNTPPRAIGDILNSYSGLVDTLALGSSDPLELNGTASTTGGNPGAVPAYEDAWDSIVEYAWDLNGDVRLDTSGNITAGAFDLFTTSVTIQQADLYLYGLDQPGDRTITFRVTDELGVKSWQTLTLHLRDVNAPALIVISPNGGETYPYSVNAENRSQQLLAWSASDNLGITRMKLSYTTKPSPAEGDWACIADTKTPGGDCDTSGLLVTDRSFTWSLPTAAEAASIGQTFPTATALFRVQAWDASDNLTTDISNSTFYIVQPTASVIETLILWNSDRTGSVASVSAKLADLASSPKVNGVVLDLKNAATLTPLYSAWDADTAAISDANPALANAVADGVRAYVKSQVEGTYTNAKYLVLVGDDHAIPFYRVDDGTATFPEGSQYSSAVDCGTPVGRAYCTNHYLTDNIFGDLDYETTSSVGVGFLALPDLATGRLVETPDEITATVDTFISQDGQIDLNKALIAGYDFLSDSATHAKKAYQDAGETVFDRIGGSWGPTDLDSDIFPASMSNRYAMHHLNVHTDHHSLGTPTGVLESSVMDAHSGRPLEGSLFYNVGCHSGLNAPDTWAAGKYPLDLPQLMLRKGAAAYVGNTGFGWGLKHGVGYSERLMELVADRVLANASSSLGDCLAQAKRDYYLENHRYDVFDEKALFESTLYGLPMYELVVDPVSLRAEVDLLKMDGPDSQESAGIVMEKSPAYNREETLPDGVTETVVNFWFGPSTYLLNATDDGGYYSLNGKTSGEVGDTLQPLFIFDSRLSGTVNHGVLFTGGHFTVEESFNPVVGVPQSSNTPLGEGPIAPGAKSIIGTITRTTVPANASSFRAEASSTQLSRLTVYTGVYDNGKESLFDRMGFAMYHSNSTDFTNPTITDPGPSPAVLHTLSGLTANFSVQASDASGIYRVVVAYTDYSSGASGEWKSFDLTNNGSAWVGSLTLKKSITYLVQAVDNAGNVGCLRLDGQDLDANSQPYGSGYSYGRTFQVTLLDTDSDSLPDVWEDANGLDKNSPADAALDGDYDLLTNLQEFNYDTDPQNGDTDGDGDNDGSELNNGRNPLLAGDGKRVTITVSTGEPPNDDDLIINWPAGLGDNTVIDGPYWVYRSTDPFFDATEKLVTSPLPLTDGTLTYTDHGAVGGPDYYYTITNVRYTGPAPVVNVVYPSTGPVAGGTSINIYGDYFTSGATVTVGGNPATVVTVVNGTTITCKTPVGTVGAKDVRVTNPNGQFGEKAGGFIYY